MQFPLIAFCWSKIGPKYAEPALRVFFCFRAAYLNSMYWHEAAWCLACNSKPQAAACNFHLQISNLWSNVSLVLAYRLKSRFAGKLSKSRGVQAISLIMISIYFVQTVIMMSFTIDKTWPFAARLSVGLLSTH